MIGKKLVKKLSKKYINIIRRFLLFFYTVVVILDNNYLYSFNILQLFKEFTNFDIALKNPSQNKPLLILFWHNRLMMIPHFFARKIRQKYPNYKIMTLASRHGDGKIVGRVMENFDFISILGSTQNGRKSSRGIGIDAIRKIFWG